MSAFSAIAEYQAQNKTVDVTSSSQKNEVERQPSAASVTRARVGEDNSEPQFRSDDNHHESAPQQNWYGASGEKVEMPERVEKDHKTPEGWYQNAGENVPMPERSEKEHKTPEGWYQNADESVPMKERIEREHKTPEGWYQNADESIPMPENRQDKEKVSATPQGWYQNADEAVKMPERRQDKRKLSETPQGWFGCGEEKTAMPVQRAKTNTNLEAPPVGWFGCGGEAVSNSSARSRSASVQKAQPTVNHFNGFASEVVIASSPVVSRKGSSYSEPKAETPRSAAYAKQQEMLSRVTFNPNRAKDPSPVNVKPAENYETSFQLARAATEKLDSEEPKEDAVVRDSADSVEIRESYEAIRKEHYRKSLNLTVSQSAIEAVEKKYKFTLGKVEAELGDVKPAPKRLKSVEMLEPAEPTEEELEAQRIREEFRLNKEKMEQERAEQERIRKEQIEADKLAKQKALEEEKRLRQERREASKVPVSQKAKYQMRYKNREGLDELGSDKYSSSDRAGALRARLARHFKSEEPQQQEGSRLASHYAAVGVDVPVVKRQGELKEDGFQRVSTDSENISKDVEMSE